MSQFVDEVDVTAVSGKGGSGAVSFRREKYVPRGGPDGGDGGKGGDVVIKVKPELRTLYDLQLRKVVKAENGSPGGGRNRKGRNGRDAVIQVPPGTVVMDRKTGRLIGDLAGLEDGLVVAEGGKGGLGNARFATPVRQAPRLAQPGRPGQQVELTLQVKFIADAGLVGLPNVGKSTLLSVLTNAKPKVGAYPFTTLVPNLGVMQYREEREFILADLPGLIEGASQGHGLGVRFLKHIERTKALLFLLDLFQGGLRTQRDTLSREIASYSSQLLHKPRLLVGSKSDVAPESSFRELEALGMEERSLAVSSITGMGIGILKDEIAALVEKANAGTFS